MYSLILLVVLISFLIQPPYVFANFLRQQITNLQTKTSEDITKDAKELGVGIAQTTENFYAYKKYFHYVKTTSF